MGRPAAVIGATTMGQVLQPTVSGAVGTIAEQTVVGGMNLLTPAGARTNPNNLLAGGRVIEERAVDINELLATGKLIEAEPVRDQAFRSTAQPFATTAVTTAPVYGNVEYVTEAVAAPTMVTEFVAPTVTTEFVAAPVQYTTGPVTEVFVQ